jgi:hypothetical protein
MSTEIILSPAPPVLPARLRLSRQPLSSARAGVFHDANQQRRHPQGVSERRASETAALARFLVSSSKERHFSSPEVSPRTLYVDRE